MITDPWIAYTHQNRFEERVGRMPRPSRFSLAAACADHALKAVARATEGLLARACAELWQPVPDAESWLAQLQALGEQVAESPGPDDPPDRAIDALLYTFAELATPEHYALEALYTAFWALAETACPTAGWVDDLLGPPDLMDELEAQVGSCRAAFRELRYQEAVLERLEQRPQPLTRREATALGEQIIIDDAVHEDFARELYRRAVMSLANSPGASLSHARVLLRFAAFEETRGRVGRAAPLYRDALTGLRPLGMSKAVDAVETHLARLTRPS